MSQLPLTSATQAPSRQAFGPQNALNDLDIDAFLELMITQLQNQDPLNPLENDELLAQISQIREVGATDNLTQTLETVLLGQNISSAIGLIGANVEGLSDDQERIQGVVERVSVIDGQPLLYLELESEARTSTEEGNIEAGTYSYQVVWEDGGQLFGVTFDGDDKVTTTGESGKDTSILLSGLPITSSEKKVYRTDASGSGDYRLVATLPFGETGSYLDTSADSDLSQQVLIGNPSQIVAKRQFTMQLNNIGEIRPPTQ